MAPSKLFTQKELEKFVAQQGEKHVFTFKGRVYAVRGLGPVRQAAVRRAGPGGGLGMQLKGLLHPPCQACVERTGRGPHG